MHNMTNEIRTPTAKLTSRQCEQQLQESSTRPTKRINRRQCEHGGNRFHLRPPLYLLPTGGKTCACKLFQNKWHTWHGADMSGMFPPLVCAGVFVGAAVRAKLCPREQKGKDQNRGKKKKKAGRSFYPLNLKTITTTFEGHTGIFVSL